MNLIAPAPTGHPAIAQGRAKRHPGYASPHLSPALKGRNGTANAGEMVSAPCGSALSGLGLYWGVEPRALPWAIAWCPVGAMMGLREGAMNPIAPAPTGHPAIAQGRAKRHPGYASPYLSPALKGRNGTANADEMVSVPCGSALSGLGVFLGIEPRALPWAIAYRPVGASEHGPRPLAKIEQDNDGLEKEIMAMLKEVV